MNASAVAARLRLPLGFLFAALYLLFALPTPLTLAIGAAIAFAGLLLRAWASGHIIKNDRLATSGPYAHTRNPLYLGSFLIAAGFAVAAHWSLLLLVIAFFALVYAPTIERERQNIRGRFGEAYDEYASNVPPFLPRTLPWRPADGVAAPFRFDLYMQHGEWKAALGYVAAVVWLVIRMGYGD